MTKKKRSWRKKEEPELEEPSTYVDKSTILLEKEVIVLLKKAKEHPRQTYTELIRNMATIFIAAKEKVHSDETEKEAAREKKIEDYIGQKILSKNNVNN